jgi:hypothetical protein
MAEAAGLVLGVVGLISVFKDAVDLFNDFTDSRDLGRDYEILDSKIDIERTILLQWADHVKLLRPDCDSRLLEANTQQAVARILACIRFLMSGESELKHRYGLSEAEEQQVTDEVVRVPTISGPRMAKFIQEFEALRLRMNLCNQSISLQKKGSLDHPG